MSYFTLICGTLAGSGRQDDVRVNQFRERGQRRRESCQKRLWNPLRLGPPTITARNREKDRDASSSKYWGCVRRPSSQPTAGEICFRRGEWLPERNTDSNTVLENRKCDRFSLPLTKGKSSKMDFRRRWFNCQ